MQLFLRALTAFAIGLLAGMVLGPAFAALIGLSASGALCGAVAALTLDLVTRSLATMSWVARPVPRPA